jgi:hypothetical protein
MFPVPFTYAAVTRGLQSAGREVFTDQHFIPFHSKLRHDSFPSSLLEMTPFNGAMVLGPGPVQELGGPISGHAR